MGAMVSLQQSAIMKLNSFCKIFIFIVFEATNESAPDIKYIYKCTCVLLFGSTNFIFHSNLLFSFQRFALLQMAIISNLYRK